MLEASRLSGELIERVKGFGFDPAQPVRCAVLLTGSNAALQRQAVSALDRFFADRRIARLTRIHGRDVVVAWQGSYTGAGLLDAVAGLPGAEKIVGGVGPVTCLREGEVFASAVAGARAAALSAGEVPGGARLTSYEDLDYCDLVLAEGPGRRPRHRATAGLSGTDGRPPSGGSSDFRRAPISTPPPARCQSPCGRPTCTPTG